ncbi:MAG: EAL domain-containing protein [Sphingorhabdus sp.]
MRILVVDDESAIHTAYRAALEADPVGASRSSFEALGSELFGDNAVGTQAHARQSKPAIDATFAYQGIEAIALIEQGRATGNPFHVAFIDIRMPPGIDGKETARRIRAIDPDINLVIVSGYSDYSVTDIAAVAGPPDKIFYISKPFAADEVRQMASALSRRWEHDARQVELLQAKVVELAASEARAVHIANHDFLTTAPNRMAFQRELTERLLHRNEPFALVALDLDRFKHVNDTFGHGAGDDLLIKVYSVLRQTAPAESLIARLGGDEFAIMFPCSDAQLGREVCRSLLQSCAQVFEVFGLRVQVSASAGYLISTDCSEDSAASDLMRYADLALFAAKREGRNRVCLFDAEMDESVRFRRQIEEGLVSALQSGELKLVYQPIVERNSLAIVGFEALARWESTEHGEIPPRVFIPIAEESGLIWEIGDWTIRRALADCRNWPGLYVSINFSPKQFKQSDLVAKLCGHAFAAGVSHNRIQIEITETAIFDDVERAESILRTLRTLGFRVALDDFGTGYSSLFNIKNFALDCIKIDKSFIDGLGHEASSTAIVRAVTQLAQALGLTVIAEGVETPAQCQALRVIGCSHLQGYLFGHGASVDLTRQRLLDEAVQIANLEDGATELRQARA